MIPLGIVIFFLSLWRKNQTLQSVALSIFIGATAFAVPAYLLGEEAEEYVEEIPGVHESDIENHEDVAEYALWLTTALGVLSILSLLATRFKPGMAGLFIIPIALTSLLATAALIITANQGGKIRHPEAYDRKLE